MRPANTRLQFANIMNFKHSSLNNFKQCKSVIQIKISYFHTNNSHRQLYSTYFVPNCFRHQILYIAMRSSGPTSLILHICKQYVISHNHNHLQILSTFLVYLLEVRQNILTVEMSALKDHTLVGFVLLFHIFY